MSTAVAASRTAYPAAHSGRYAHVTGRVRLTPRGRAVLLGLFVALAFALMAMFGGQSAATDEGGRPVPTRIVVVGEGDTLWEIASAIAEPGETREMIHYIEELNAMSSPSLMEGQRLAVPVRSAG